MFKNFPKDACIKTYKNDNNCNAKIVFTGLYAHWISMNKNSTLISMT